MSEIMDKKIVSFIKRHHVVTLCSFGHYSTSIQDSDICGESNNEPDCGSEGVMGRGWCANLFYAFDSERSELIFTSGADTLHARQMSECAEVAGSIVLESKVVGRLQGLQFRGVARLVVADNGDNNDYSHYSSLFIKRFPYAALSIKEIWVVRLTGAKYTDNTLGFGTKLLWGSL